MFAPRPLSFPSTKPPTQTTTMPPLRSTSTTPTNLHHTRSSSSSWSTTTTSSSSQASTSYNCGRLSIYSPLTHLFTTTPHHYPLGDRLRQLNTLSHDLMRDTYALSTTVHTCILLLTHACTPLHAPTPGLSTLPALVDELQDLAYGFSTVLGAMQTLERQLSAVREDEDGDVGGDAAEGIRAMEGSEGMVRELLEALYFDLAPMKGLVAGLMEEVKVVGLERVVRWLETAEEREMGGFESLWGRGGQVGCWLSWRNGEAVVMDVVGLGLW